MLAAIFATIATFEVILLGKHQVPLFGFVIIARFQRSKLVESVHMRKGIISLRLH